MSTLKPSLDPAFQQVLNALTDSQAEWLAEYLLPLSDLEGEEAEAFTAIWPRIHPDRKLVLLEAMEQNADENFLLDFEHVCRLAISDHDPQVRFLGVRALNLYEPVDLIDTFRTMLAEDPDENVRAVCALALGHFVYLGEIEEIPRETYQQILESLLTAAQGSDTREVRRRALEALGFAGHPEVNRLIEDAYQTGERDWLASAIFAMGRSYDARWHNQVMEMLNHHMPDIRFEAARAAGELEITSARPRLIELLDDSDSNVRMAAAWSLSQIGGQGVLAALETLQSQALPENELTLLDEAISNLLFNEGIGMFDLMEIDELDFDLDDENEPG